MVSFILLVNVAPSAAFQHVDRLWLDGPNRYPHACHASHGNTAKPSAIIGVIK
jgi:hypothetical protein